MMNDLLIAKVGLARLRLPVPTAKHIIIHSAAQNLNDTKTSNIMWESFIEWISQIDLESEIVEALCIPLLAKSSACIDINELERAISRHSPLSSIYINQIAEKPVLVNTWANCHSIEVPSLFSSKEILDKLKDGRIVPPILANRLAKLERKSGQPFLKQWAFEFQRLTDTIEELRDGHWEYFIDGERDQRNVGQFITRRGQAARSAYLRTLSLAYDYWGMPEDMVYDEAMYTTPADLTFLCMPPGDPPPWLPILTDETPISLEEWQGFIKGLVRRISDDYGSDLLYVNAPINRKKLYKSDLEFLSYFSDDIAIDCDDAFNIQEYLMGKTELRRLENGIINCTIEGASSPKGGQEGGVLPALLPCVVRHFGYIHSDLAGRSPCLPVIYSSENNLLSIPRSGGFDLVLDGNIVGEACYWNWKWSPVHDKALGPNCGFSVAVSRDFRERMLNVYGLTFHRCWRAKILTRAKEYGDWEERVIQGLLE